MFEPEYAVPEDTPNKCAAGLKTHYTGVYADTHVRLPYIVCKCVGGSYSQSLNCRLLIHVHVLDKLDMFFNCMKHVGSIFFSKEIATFHSIHVCSSTLSTTC